MTIEERISGFSEEELAALHANVERHLAETKKRAQHDADDERKSRKRKSKKAKKAKKAQRH